MLPVIVPAGEHCIAASASVPKVTCFFGPSDPPASSPGVFRADPDPEPGVPDLPRLLLLLLGDKTLLPTLSRLVTFCNLQQLKTGQLWTQMQAEVCVGNSIKAELGYLESRC